jgi:hypothetical protein
MKAPKLEDRRSLIADFCTQIDKITRAMLGFVLPRDARTGLQLNT